MKGNGIGGRKPEEIQAEIERTRTEMDATLKQIEHRLTPGQLMDQGIDYLKHSGARQYLTNLGGSVKDNPMPVTLTGIALAWLMASANRPVQYKFVETQRDPSVNEGMEAARDTMDSAKERIGDTMSTARDKAYAMRDSARHQAERARSGWDTMVREQPLALGAIGFALGALVAAMAPRTRREDELMGPARDRLIDQAKQAGSEKLEQAKQVAGAAMETVKKEAPGGDGAAKRQGTSSDPATTNPASMPKYVSTALHQSAATDQGGPEAETPSKGDSSQNPPSFVQHSAPDNGPRNPS